MELPTSAPVPYRIAGFSGVTAAPKSGKGGVGAALSLVAQRHPRAGIDLVGAGPVMALSEVEMRGRCRARHMLDPQAAAENLRDSVIGGTTLLFGQHNGPIDRYGVATEPYVLTVADLGNGPEVVITDPSAAEPVPYERRVGTATAWGDDVVGDVLGFRRFGRTPDRVVRPRSDPPDLAHRALSTRNTHSAVTSWRLFGSRPSCPPCHLS